MTHHGVVFVCAEHRHASHWDAEHRHASHWDACRCGNGITTGPRWRAPRKNNDRAWKMIASGDLLWDKKAVARKSKRWNEKMDAFWENLKRRNPKAKYPFERM